MEEVSGENLEDFFQQWIFIKGYPELKWDWEFRDGQITLQIDQIQDHHIFNFPLEIAIIYTDHIRKEMVQLNDQSTTLKFNSEDRPERVLLDPEVWLLFQDKNN
jgi:aminopeptidase N